MSERPAKNDLPVELRRVLNTLTDDAQQAALRKLTDAGLEPNKGRIPLAETLINFNDVRDTLLDAIEKGKFVQLPLKIQDALFDQVKGVEQELGELREGKDAVLNLERAVEDLTAATWQFQLHNLSGQVLGYQTKMNQLKHEETRIREVLGLAGEFSGLHGKLTTQAEEATQRSTTIANDQTAAASVVEKLEGLLKEAGELGQKVAASAVEAERQATGVVQQLATAKQSSADTEAIAAKSKEMRSEIDAARTALEDLTKRAQQLLTKTEVDATEQLGKTEADFAKFRGATETELKTLTTKLDDSITTLTSGAASQVEQLTASTATTMKKLSDDTQESLAQQLGKFGSDGTAAVETFNKEATAAIKAGNDEYQALMKHLAELQGQIQKSIELATGYSLFHAFQTRQLQVARSKWYWGVALASSVAVAIAVSMWFIWQFKDLQGTPPVAFYLKLSLSLPLIYLIAFCNVQFSHERKLEEEYAFKSSISISLDPYQKLVGSLVDQGNKEEVARHTKFIIQSVNRVFTSPLETSIGSTRRERTYMARMMKLVEPVFKALKKP